MNQPNEPGKLTKPAEPIFENDLGQSPLLFAHLTQDQGVIAVAALTAGFVLTACAGLPAAVIVGLVAANDLLFCHRKAKLADPTPDEDTQWKQVNAIASGIEPEPEPTPTPTDAPVTLPIPQPEIFEEPADSPLLQPPQPAQLPATDGAPDLTSGTIEQRIERLMDAMGNAGMPIRRLIRSPFLWAYGQSQSGKSTLINLVNLLRSGLGIKIWYGTTDDDYPLLRWHAIATTESGYQAYAMAVSCRIESAAKGSLEGESYTFDEFYAACTRELVDSVALVSPVIQKGPKTGVLFNVISQNDTLEPHGLKGMRAAIDAARVLIAPVRGQTPEGRAYPTGQYLITFPGEATQTWTIPAWMLTDTNRWGKPDPIEWVLNRLPELRGSDPNVKARLEKLLSQDVSSTPETHFNPPETSETGISETISDYPETKEKFRNEAQDGHFNVSNDSEMISKHFTPQKLTRDQAIAFIQSMKHAGNSQTKIIEVLWSVKPGGSKAYQDAIAEYKELVGE